MAKNYIYTYPAIFTLDVDNKDEGYDITFPDLDGCFTCGYGVEHAYEMAKEILSIHIECFIQDMGNSPKALPAPSNPNTIDVPEGSFLSLIQVDMKDFFIRYRNKAVKKTLTIPEWLNASAEKKGINFSQVLQDALKERLGA